MKWIEEMFCKVFLVNACSKDILNRIPYLFYFLFQKRYFEQDGFDWKSVIVSTDRKLFVVVI